MGRKNRGKRRNCSLGAITPSPTLFSKDLFCKTGLVRERLKANAGLKGKALADNKFSVCL